MGTEGDGEVGGGVADGEAGGTREAGLLGELAKDVGAAVVGALLLAVGEVAEDDAAHAGEDAGELQVGPHAINPIGALADVLEEEDGALEGGQVGGAEEAGEDGEVAAEERPLGEAGDVGVLAEERRRRLGGLEEAEEGVLDVGGLDGEMGEDGPEDGDAAVGLEGEVEGGDVGEADEGGGGGVGERESGKEAHAAIAAAGAEDGAGVGVGERVGELFGATGVGAGEVAPGVEEVGAEGGGVPLGDEGETDVEAGAVEGTCGGDDEDGILGAERERLEPAHGAYIALGGRESWGN